MKAIVAADGGELNPDITAWTHIEAKARPEKTNIEFCKEVDLAEDEWAAILLRPGERQTLL